MAGDRLRVALDVSAVPQRPVGAGRYTIELAANLARQAAIDLSLLTRRDDAERWRTLAGGADVLPCAPVARPLRVAFGELGLSRAMGRLALTAEVLHGPHYTLPLRPPCPTVVTVHDLTVVDHPEWHEPSKVLLFRRALARAARHANVVVCVSEATALRFKERFAPKGAVLVVPHGLDHERFHPADEVSEHADAEVLQRLRIRAPFVLHVGTLEPRKDVGRLVEAFDTVATGRPGLSLVLAGPDGWGLSGLEATLATARHGERIHRLGYVEGTDVAALVRNASVVAYPSLEEGFGLPALEALACGSPLVTSEGSVMATIASGAAFLAAPGDARSLAGCLEEVLEGGPPLTERRRIGLEVARAHSWERVATRHLEAYRLAAGR